MMTAWWPELIAWPGWLALLLLACLYAGALLILWRSRSRELARLVRPGGSALGGGLLVLLFVEPADRLFFALSPRPLLIWGAWMGAVWAFSVLSRRTRLDRFLPEGETPTGAMVGATLFVTLPTLLLLHGAGLDLKALVHGPGALPGSVASLAVLLALWGSASSLRPLLRVVKGATLAGLLVETVVRQLFTAALAEELLFRVLAQPWMQARLGTVGGLIVVALAFGLLHIFRTQAGLTITKRRERIALVILLHVSHGLFLGVLFAATGSLWFVVAFHAMHNGLAQLPRALGARIRPVAGNPAV
jgi:membrane protease YdiL (CAAX protease family)